MQLFYTTMFKGNHAILDENDSRHVVKVLRMSEGDKINMTDGLGNMFTGQIEAANHKRCLVQIIEKTANFGQRDFKVHMAVAPTKNISRYEWFLEKATEIGVDEITPIICGHSERAHIKTDRLERVLVAAMKQSLKASLPKINPATKLKDFLVQDYEAAKFIAYIAEDVTDLLKNKYQKQKDALILIGPEGDFSPAEFELAKDKGYLPISLGKSRLRTETAAIVACHTISLLND
jgi:16S rRNA (uracil1498-N3)-methyltransferase